MTQSKKKPNFSIAVYCGSREGAQPAFAYVAGEVGRWIGEHGGRLIYGGGKAGLMGIVAQATLDAGGTVYGVIPEALVNRELAKHDITELHIVKTMHERKAMMAEEADVFVTLPGGIGTFEEMFEMWTLRQLGYHDKPMGLVNTNGYYDQLLGFISDSMAGGFVSDWQREMLHVADEAPGLLQELVQLAGMNAKPRLSEI
jgi:uncharacterized protein (TIGR00730 family)